MTTLLHHVQSPWEMSLVEQGYYFCDDPECDVVYFGQDGSVISKNMIRSKIWQKTADKDCVICHCFGVTKQQEIENQFIKSFIDIYHRFSYS